MLLFCDYFKKTFAEECSIHDLAIFSVVVYLRTWLTSPIAVDAPKSELLHCHGATTSCVSYMSSLALSLQLLLLLLSALLSHLGLTTAPHSTLVPLLCVWAASSGLSALPRTS